MTAWSSRATPPRSGHRCLTAARSTCSTWSWPFLKEIEDSIGIEEANLVRELDSGAGKRLADAQRARGEVTGWIAERSPADLAAAACFAEKGPTLRDRFLTVPSPGCHPLARPNYGYFNKALPRSAPQVVIIKPIARCFDTANKYNRDANSPSPAGCRANRALIETLDKDAVRAWLREPKDRSHSATV